jgi:hypothetical protein
VEPISQSRVGVREDHGVDGDVGDASPTGTERVWVASPRRPSIVRNVVIALLIGVIVATPVALFVKRRRPTFESAAVVVLDSKRVYDPRVGAAEILRLNALRRKYSALVRTSDVAGVAARTAHVTPAIAASHARVLITQDALVMYPVAEASTGREAALLAKGLADALVSLADREQADAGVAEPDRVKLRLVQPPFAHKVSPTSKDVTTAGISAGVAAAALAYVLLQLITPGRRRR